MKKMLSVVLSTTMVVSVFAGINVRAESSETSEMLYNESFDFESNTNWKSMYIATWKNGIVKDVLGNDKFVADPTNSGNKVMSVNAIAGDGTSGSDGGYANIFSTPITVDQKKNVIIDAKVYINDDSESNDFIMLTPILDQGKIWGSTTVYPTPSFMFGKGSIGAANTVGKNLRLRVGAEASSEALKTIDEPAQYPQDYYANGTSAGAFVNSVSTTTDWQNNITMPVKQWVNLRYVMNPETNTVRIYLGTTENDMQPISMSYYYNDEKTSYPVSDRKQHYDFFPYEGDRANASYMPGSVTMPSVDNNTHKTFEKIYGLTSFTRGSNSNFYVDDIKIYQPSEKLTMNLKQTKILNGENNQIVLEYSNPLKAGEVDNDTFDIKDSNGMKVDGVTITNEMLSTGEIVSTALNMPMLSTVNGNVFTVSCADKSKRLIDVDGQALNIGDVTKSFIAVDNIELVNDLLQYTISGNNTEINPFKLKNNTSAEKTVTCIAVAYGKYNNMLGVHIEDVAMQPESESDNVTLSIKNVNDASSVKLLVWSNLGTMIPILNYELEKSE